MCPGIVYVSYFLFLLFSKRIKQENNALYSHAPCYGAFSVHFQTWCYLVTFRWHVRRKHDPTKNFRWVSSVFRRRRWATTRAFTSTSSAHICQFCEGHFHALCLTRAHFDTYNFKEKNLLGSKYNVFSMYDKCINVKIKRWQSAKSFWRSLPTNASISLSKFYNSILYFNKLGLCVNRFKTKNISIVGVLKFFHFVHFH